MPRPGPAGPSSSLPLRHGFRLSWRRPYSYPRLHRPRADCWHTQRNRLDCLFPRATRVTSGRHTAGEKHAGTTTLPNQACKTLKTWDNGWADWGRIKVAAKASSNSTALPPTWLATCPSAPATSPYFLPLLPGGDCHSSDKPLPSPTPSWSAQICGLSLNGCLGRCLFLNPFCLDLPFSFP